MHQKQKQRQEEEWRQSFTKRDLHIHNERDRHSKKINQVTKQLLAGGVDYVEDLNDWM